MFTFGQRLRYLRRMKGMRISDVTAEAGVFNLGRFENDERKPGLDILLKIANYYEVSVDWLLRGDEYERYIKHAPEAASLIKGTELPREDQDLLEKFLLFLEWKNSRYLFEEKIVSGDDHLERFPLLNSEKLNDNLSENEVLEAYCYVSKDILKEKVENGFVLEALEDVGSYKISKGDLVLFRSHSFILEMVPMLVRHINGGISLKLFCYKDGKPYMMDYSESSEGIFTKIDSHSVYHPLGIFVRKLTKNEVRIVEPDKNSGLIGS